MDALDKIENCKIIFTKANSDTDGRIVNQMIDDYVAKNTSKAVCFTSLGQLRYLSALQYVDAMIGNSSSGLLEAPSFKIATVNIGDRQRGRIMANSVIQCNNSSQDIEFAINKAISTEFKEILKTIENPYKGVEAPSKEIVEVLKSIDLNDILKKQFYDL